jgi:hypothetical protein
MVAIDPHRVFCKGISMAHVHAPGLVLRLDPKTLANEGASYTGADDEELSPQQYFVCLESNAKDALWVPLFAAPGTDRKGIAEAAKTGQTRWTRSPSFYDQRQLCRVAHKAAQRAAAAAYDESTPKAANRIITAQLPARADFAADGDFHPMADNYAIR